MRVGAPRLAMLGLALALLAPGIAIAQAAGSGDALLREGVELRRQGRDEDALEAFRRAYERDHSAVALAQMGLAEQAVGRWLASEEHVRGALGMTDHPWIQRNHEEIERAYATI